MKAYREWRGLLILVPILPVVSTPFSRPKILSFDHVSPSPSLTLDTPPRTAILYASLDSENFRELHSYLLSHASSNSIEYVLRYIPPQHADDAPRSFLSGYGVALDLKKMDYLAVDDRNMNGGGLSFPSACPTTRANLMKHSGSRRRYLGGDWETH